MTVQHPHPSYPTPPQRILIVRPSALGDVCRTVPVLVSLKRTFPSARVDWLVQDSFAPAINQHPDLGRVIPFHRRRLASLHNPAVARELVSFLLSIRSAAYDLVLDCQGLARSALFTRVTGAGVRVGFRNAAELGWLGLNLRVKAPRTLHTVDRMLLLAQAAGCSPLRDLRLYSAPADREAVQRRYGLSAGSFAVLAPTTRWPGKLWPQDRFIELARRMLSDPCAGVERVVIVGSASERAQCEAITHRATSDTRFVDLVGKTSVGELLALIEASRLVIGSDSAPIHIAVGFNRPLVALYGPTDVGRVGPYRRSENVIQHIRPGDNLGHKNERAGRALMQRITIDQVLACALGQLTSRSPTASSISPPAPVRAAPVDSS